MKDVHKNCEERLRTACLKHHPVIFLLEQINKLGCEIGIKNRKFLCEKCPKEILGGFDPDKKEVVICENNVHSQRRVNRLLTHELVHAFDVCRAKLNFHNLQHHACTEIRAANLSRDCSFCNENFREFKFALKSHKQDCVKRRATLSLTVAHDGLSRLEASQAVDSVFEHCYNDHSPFENAHN